MAKRLAIIGRPNVGKSTLFNRLAGRRLALVHDMPGVTRDRREAPGTLADLEFIVVDTAGIDDDGEKDSLTARMRGQTEVALKSADVVLFLVDARAGMLAQDRDFAHFLHRVGKTVVLAANKAEKGGASAVSEFFALGFGAPVAISAEHGEGMGDLHEALAPYLSGDEEDRLSGQRGRGSKRSEARAAALAATEAAAEAGTPLDDDPDKPLSMAIIGRPNVGKSTLVNRLLGEERVLTGPEAGITRDSITVPWMWRDKPVRLVDTAGVRRRPRVSGALEHLSVSDTFSTIRFAEVCVLVVDATQLLEKQDLTIAREVAEEGRSLVIAVNKWDLITDKNAKLAELRDILEAQLPQLSGIEVVTLSAITGNGTEKLMPAVLKAMDVWNTRIPTPKLNRWLEEAQSRNPPPLVAGRRLRLRYMTQSNIRPPTFALFASKPGDLPDSYTRYLINMLRSTFDLPGTPIRVMLRKGKNPYDKK